MKVYLGKLCYCDNGCDVWKTVEKVFDDEVKALLWQEESFTTDHDIKWREYEEMGVE
jgi:hypothetical protein